MVIADNRGGDPSFALFSGSPAARSPISTAPGSGSRCPRPERRERPIQRATCSRSTTSWPGVPSSFSAGGLTPFGHALKPDVTAPGANILSSTLPEFAGDPFIVLDGYELLRAARLRRSCTPPSAASDVDAEADEVGVDVHRRAAFSNSALTEEASVLLQGAGLVNVTRGRPAADLHRPAVAVVWLPGCQRRSGQPCDSGD